MARNSEEKISPTMPTAKRRKTFRLRSRFPLEDLPDEIILKIFSFLDRKHLFRVSLVSKRTYNISQDCSMSERWLEINFWNKTLPTSLLEKVLIKGCKYLILQHATLEGNLRLTKRTSLKYLDISDPIQAGQGVLNQILASCYSLEKLWLINFYKWESININVMSVQNGQTLQVLNMIGCRRLNLDKIKPLMDNCVQLKELNLKLATDITEEAVDYLVNNLTPNIERLSLGFLWKLIGDHEIKILVSRCKKLNSLYLMETRIGNDSLMNIIENLQETLVNLNVENTLITSGWLRELKSMSKLKILNCDGRQNVKRLRKLLPNVKVNYMEDGEQTHFSIAPSRTGRLF